MAAALWDYKVKYQSYFCEYEGLPLTYGLLDPVAPIEGASEAPLIYQGMRVFLTPCCY